MRSILIVEDDPEMGQVLERGIRAQDYDARLVTNGVDALIEVSQQQFAAAVIDVMLPGMSGFEVCRRIRQTGSTLPLLLLTARDGVDDRVFGLDSGADDYLTKPFSFDELAARLRALLRRDPAEQWTLLTCGDITVNARSHRVDVAGRPLALSPNEYQLLWLLISRPGETTDRSQILDAVWGSPHLHPNIVDQYVSTLRKKLVAHDSSVSIETIRGVGYRATASAA